MLSDTQRSMLAARLRQGRRPVPKADDGPIVVLGAAGAPPAFALHAIGGSVHEYAPLARALAGTWQLFGIEAAGLRPGSTPSDSLAELADRYADAVRAAQPAGPYRLLGWSMGGVLAFETARRLEALGEPVQLVALIDAPYRTVPCYADSEAGLAALFVVDALRGAGHHRPESSAELPVPDQLDRLAARLTTEPGERADMVAELHRRYAVFAAHTTALAGYLPAGPVTAAGVLAGAHASPDSAPDWARMFSGGTRAVRLDTDHHGCLRPPAVSTIADTITAAVSHT